MTKPNPQIVRAENMRRLVAEFGKRNLMQSDARSFLGLSDSGIRSYVFELVEASMIQIVARFRSFPNNPGQAVFQLTGDRPVIDTFLAKLGTKPPKRESRKRGRGEIPTDNPARHIYVSLDDTAARVAPTGPVEPDPMALPSDFFKPSTDFCERRSEPRPEPVRLTGFAALDVRFERRVG